MSFLTKRKQNRIELVTRPGAYQQCIKNCQLARLSDPALAVEKDGYMYRAYLAQVNMTT